MPSKKENLWTDEEIKFLEKNISKMSYEDMSKVLERTKQAISQKASKLKLSTRPRWTDEETKTLLELIEEKKIGYIAKKLGRTNEAIIQRLNKLGYSAAYNGDKISFYEIVSQMGFLSAYDYLLKKWTSMGLKVYNVYIRNSRVRMVNIDEFWKWAEPNKDKLDFSKLKHNALGYEPTWATEKIKRDHERKINQKTNLTWTKDEEAMLLNLVKIGKDAIYISKRLNRSQTSINCKLLRMKSMYRANTIEKSFWTEEEEIKLEEMIKNGKTYDEVSYELNRSVSACRRKHVRMKQLVE